MASPGSSRGASPRGPLDGSVLAEELHRLEAENKILTSRLSVCEKEAKVAEKTEHDLDKSLRAALKNLDAESEQSQNLREEVTQLRDAQKKQPVMHEFQRKQTKKQGRVSDSGASANDAGTRMQLEQAQSDVKLLTKERDLMKKDLDKLQKKEDRANTRLEKLESEKKEEYDRRMQLKTNCDNKVREQQKRVAVLEADNAVLQRVQAVKTSAIVRLGEQLKSAVGESSGNVAKRLDNDLAGGDSARSVLGKDNNKLLSVLSRASSAQDLTADAQVLLNDKQAAQAAAERLKTQLEQKEKECKASDRRVGLLISRLKDVSAALDLETPNSKTSAAALAAGAASDPAFVDRLTGPALSTEEQEILEAEYEPRLFCKLQAWYHSLLKRLAEHEGEMTETRELYDKELGSLSASRSALELENKKLRPRPHKAAVEADSARQKPAKPLTSPKTSGIANTPDDTTF